MSRRRPCRHHPGVRGGKYHAYTVRAVGFPDGVAHEPLLHFLRQRCNPVQGLGGVQLATHAWGLEAALVFQSPDAAARAVDVLEKLESLDLNVHGAVHSVALTSRIRAKLTEKPRRGSKEGLHFKTNVTTVTVQATAPPPMLVLMPAPYATPFAPQHYPCYNAPMYIPAPQLPLPPTYVLVPDPLYARGGGKSSP